MDVLSAFDSWLEDVRREEDQITNPVKLKSVCKQATKDVRIDIIRSWYTYNWASTVFATQYNQSVDKSGSGESRKIVVTTDSYVDSARFHPHSSTAQKWLDRHPDVPAIYPPNEYVLNLIMDQGIIGLPATSTVSDWKNNNFKIARNGLEAEYETSPIWKTFESKVKGML